MNIGGTRVSSRSGFLGVYAQEWDCWVTWQFYFQFFKEISSLFSIVAVIICIPTNSVRGFPFLVPSFLYSDQDKSVGYRFEKLLGMKMKLGKIRFKKQKEQILCHSDLGYKYLSRVRKIGFSFKILNKRTRITVLLSRWPERKLSKWVDNKLQIRWVNRCLENERWNWAVCMTSSDEVKGHLNGSDS